MQKISVTLQNKYSNSKFLNEDRRRTVARLLAQSMTETEIAIRLDVHASTICRDIKALKAKSQQFVYDLAKSDLAYYYKQCIEGIDQANRESWKIHLIIYYPTKNTLERNPNKNKIFVSSIEITRIE